MTNLILLLPALKFPATFSLRVGSSCLCGPYSGSLNSCSLSVLSTLPQQTPWLLPDRDLLNLQTRFYVILAGRHPSCSLFCAQGVLFTCLCKSKCQHIVNPRVYYQSKMGIHLFVFVSFLVPNRHLVKFAS